MQPLRSTVWATGVGKGTREELQEVNLGVDGLGGKRDMVISGCRRDVLENNVWSDEDVKEAVAGCMPDDEQLVLRGGRGHKSRGYVVGGGGLVRSDGGQLAVGHGGERTTGDEYRHARLGAGGVSLIIWTFYSVTPMQCLFSKVKYI
jgi:hypothetical protein